MRRSVCASPFTVPGLAEPLDVTVSIGVACADASDESVESLLKRSDEALYEAKRTGRNRVIGRSSDHGELNAARGAR